MKIALISDNHCTRPEIPECDLLLHAGDLTFMGKQEELAAEIRWLASLPCPVILISGNHDWFFYHAGPEVSQHFILGCGAKNIFYLQDDFMLFKELTIYGSPWQPWFYNWAFNAHRGPEIRKHWDKIPECDILITHGPPHGICDRSYGGGPTLGCQDLMDAVLRTKPKLHVFGHIHGGYGEKIFNGTTFVNASVVNEQYKLVNSPIIFEL